MLHEISPRVYHPEYINKKAVLSAYSLCYKGNSVLLIKDKKTDDLVQVFAGMVWDSDKKAVGTIFWCKEQGGN